MKQQSSFKKQRHTGQCHRVLLRSTTLWRSTNSAGTCACDVEWVRVHVALNGYVCMLNGCGAMRAMRAKPTDVDTLEGGRGGCAG